MCISNKFCEMVTLRDALSLMRLTPMQRNYVDGRYIPEVHRSRRERVWTDLLFLLLTNVVTIGGVLIASLLSLEKINILPRGAANAIFWVCWTLSIIVVVSNKLLYTFNLHRKYILCNIALEKLKSEGWQYATGMGKYDGDPDENFRRFSSRVERFKMKSVETRVSKGKSDSFSSFADLTSSIGDSSIVGASNDHVSQPTPAMMKMFGATCKLNAAAVADLEDSSSSSASSSSSGEDDNNSDRISDRGNKDNTSNNEGSSDTCEPTSPATIVIPLDAARILASATLGDAESHASDSEDPDESSSESSGGMNDIPLDNISDQQDAVE